MKVDLPLLISLFKSVILRQFTPIFVGYAVTYRCVSRCPMCRQIRLKSKELNTKQAKSLLTLLRQSGTKFLHITGGEPLIRLDLEEILSHARSLGFYMTMNTSTGDPYSQLGRALNYLDTLVVSIDGNEETHDRNRGAGTFQNVLKTIEMCKQRKKRVRLNMVYGNYNFQQIPQMAEFAKNLKVPIGFRPIVLDESFDSEENALYMPSIKTKKSVTNYLRESMKINKYIYNSQDGLLTVDSMPGFGNTLPCNVLYSRVSPAGEIRRCGLKSRGGAAPLDLSSVEALKSSMKRLAPVVCSKEELCCIEFSNILRFRAKSVVKMMNGM